MRAVDSPVLEHLAKLLDVALKQSFSAIWTEPVSKVRFRVVMDVGFQLGPIPLVVPDFLAARTDGQKPAQDLDAVYRVLEFSGALGNTFFQKVACHFEVCFDLFPFRNLCLELAYETSIGNLKRQ